MISNITKRKKILFKTKFLQTYKNMFLKTLICLMLSLLIFTPSYLSANASIFLFQPESTIDKLINPLAISPCTNINFPNPVFSTGSSPQSTTIGDIDGDGKSDLIVANATDNTVSVLRNTSTTGTISFANQQVFSTGTLPYSVAAGDIDGDGKADLAVANLGSNTVSVLRNTSTIGVISFTDQLTFSTGNLPYSVTVGDIDGDGKADLAVANLGFNAVSVLRNTSTIGTISFDSQGSFSTGINPKSVVMGDIDGDGKSDLVTANSSSNTVSVLKNTSSIGTISFNEQQSFPTDINPISVAVGDIDGDGKSDLVTANDNVSTVSLLRNTSTTGTISFTNQQSFSTNNRPQSVAIEDIDGDSKADLAVANLSNTTSVLRNTSTIGAISFAHQQTFLNGNNPISVAAEDVDGDGKSDLAIANLSSSTVSILRNTSIVGGYII